MSHSHSHAHIRDELILYKNTTYILVCISMIIGVSLIVDDLQKGQKLVYRYPETLPAALVESNSPLLKYVHSFLPLLTLLPSCPRRPRCYPSLLAKEGVAYYNTPH